MRANSVFQSRKRLNIEITWLLFKR
jgi:hypothetical protein